MTRCLIVLNATLGGEELRSEVQQRIEDGCTFRLLAPAHGAGVEEGVIAAGPISSEPAAAAPGDEPGTPKITGDQARRWADDILREAADQLRELGADIEHAEVGDPDALAAIEQVLAEDDVDDVLIATPPQRLAGLVSMDLPSRAERRFDVPVTAVTGPVSAPPR